MVLSSPLLFCLGGADFGNVPVLCLGSSPCSPNSGGEILTVVRIQLLLYFAFLYLWKYLEL